MLPYVNGGMILTQKSTTMLFELDTNLEGYNLIGLLGKSTSYRDVYHVREENSDKDMIMIVYNLKALPDCFDEDVIPEFEVAKNLVNITGETKLMFPEFVEHGHLVDEFVAISWMVLEYENYTTLHDYIFSNNSIDEKEILLQFYNLLIGIKELSWQLGGGCHNNISTNSVLVYNDKDGNTKLRIAGLNCVSMKCEGTVTFDRTIPSVLFKAPETLIGHYNIKTDIFALGILLAYILQKKHPWEEGITSYGENLNDARMVRYMKDNDAQLDMEEPLKKIVARAISLKPSRRFQNIEEFAFAIAKYLGIEQQRESDFLTKEVSKKDIFKQNSNTEETAEDSKQQVLSQPKSNVKIERVTGNGFKDVAGMEQLKCKLTRNFVSIMQNRELAEQFHITPPNGILLWGPPGTGKSFISKKLAEESGLLFSVINPSDLGSIYIHGSQNMIADLFNRGEEMAAKNNCGVLLVFEEFDSLVPKRGTNDDNNQANEVAEFLTRLNDCANKNVFVVATTNRIDAIDPAIIRHGRVDEIIYVGLPDDNARKELIELELVKRPHDEIDTNHIAKLTHGYTSSDISFIVKECARRSFDVSVQAKHLVKINQDLLERTIAETRPSVTPDELKQYEKMNEKFIKGKNNERPRIGFNII